MNLHRLAFVLATATACVDPSAIGESQLSIADNSDPGDYGSNEACGSRIVEGYAFYNDQRDDGQFGLRFDNNGNGGRRENFSGDLENYLGLLDARAVVYEVGVYDGVPNLLKKLGHTTIDERGFFSWAGFVCDQWDDGAADLAVKIVLKQCDDRDSRCFSVKSPDDHPDGDHYDEETWNGDVWSQWHLEATQSEPRHVVGSYPFVAIGTHYFQTLPYESPALLSDVTAQAASIFASMVDVTRAVHTSGGVPYDHDAYGQVDVFYPNPIGGRGHSHEASRLCISEVSGWVSGYSTAHEYGHIVHYQSWDGVGKWVSLCYEENTGLFSPKCERTDDDFEYGLQAFKEGWADFIGRTVSSLDDPDASNSRENCNELERLPMTTCGGPAPCIDQRHIATDVAKVLCDFWDDSNDISTQFGRAIIEGHTASIEEMREVLLRVFADADTAERDDVLGAEDMQGKGATAPLGLCRFANTYVELHPSKEASIVSVLDHNGVICAID